MFSRASILIRRLMQRVDAEVPVKTTGDYRGLIKGGLLSWARHQVTISAKPADIPSELVLDIRRME